MWVFQPMPRETSSNSQVIQAELIESIRFWGKVQITPGCWLWTAGKRSTGYGTFSRGRKPELAHRASWVYYNGPVPCGLFVCHRCDVRECVNPDHLFLGTARDNVRDMFSKGRGRPGKPHGVKNGSAKLDDTKVQQIRQCWAKGETTKQLAGLYRVSREQINNIVSRRCWSHLNECKNKEE